jgi:hypothetical protein
MPSSLPFEIRGSAIAGQGAFAIRPIAKGERLIEYTGERISHAVADARYDDESMAEHHTFLFAVTDRTVIDATHGGNEARFINHSCDPNLQVEKWYVNRTPRLGLWAKRPILAGEEFSYNYSVKWHGDPDVAQLCYCGAYNCTGYLGLPPKR